MSNRTSRSCCCEVTTGAHSSFTCMGFSQSPWVQLKCFQEATAFAYLCTTWLRNLPFYNSTLSPFVFSLSLGSLALPHHHYNLHPWLILLCSSIQGTGEMHTPRSVLRCTNPCWSPVHLHSSLHFSLE